VLFVIIFLINRSDTMTVMISGVLLLTVFFLIQVLAKTNFARYLKLLSEVLPVRVRVPEPNIFSSNFTIALRIYSSIFHYNVYNYTTNRQHVYSVPWFSCSSQSLYNYIRMIHIGAHFQAYARSSVFFLQQKTL